MKKRLIASIILFVAMIVPEQQDGASDCGGSSADQKSAKEKTVKTLVLRQFYTVFLRCFCFHVDPPLFIRSADIPL